LKNPHYRAYADAHLTSDLLNGQSHSSELAVSLCGCETTLLMRLRVVAKRPLFPSGCEGGGAEGMISKEEVLDRINSWAHLFRCAKVADHPLPNRLSKMLKA
jgi:hypothetical protein